MFRKLFQEDRKVILYEAAIGSNRSKAVMHVAAADDSSSLLPISELHRRLIPGATEARTETVNVCRLSDYVAAEEICPPAMLKLDVQGYELEALLGCEQLLNRFDQIYVECSFVELYEGQPMAYEIIAYLAKRRFRLIGIYNMSYDHKGQAIQGDFLFETGGNLQ